MAASEEKQTKNSLPRTYMPARGKHRYTTADSVCLAD